MAASVGLSLKFLGEVWPGRTKVLPSAVIHKVQAFLLPPVLKQLKDFFGLLEYWHSFILHLVQLLRSLYRLTKKGQLCDWVRMEQDAF